MAKTPTAQDFCDRASFRIAPATTKFLLQAMLDDRVYTVTGAGPDAVRVTGHGVNVTLGFVNGKFVPEGE